MTIQPTSARKTLKDYPNALEHVRQAKLHLEQAVALLKPQTPLARGVGPERKVGPSVHAQPVIERTVIETYVEKLNDMIAGVQQMASTGAYKPRGESSHVSFIR